MINGLHFPRPPSAATPSASTPGQALRRVTDQTHPSPASSVSAGNALGLTSCADVVTCMRESGSAPPPLSAAAAAVAAARLSATMVRTSRFPTEETPPKHVLLHAQQAPMHQPSEMMRL